MNRAAFNKKHFTRPDSRVGFSLIETAIVLAIMGLLVGSIWVAASSLRARQAEQDLMTGFEKIIDNGQKYLTQGAECYSGNYLETTAPDLWALIYPQEWKRMDMSLFFRWGPVGYTPCDGDNVRTFSLYFGESTEWGDMMIDTRLTAMCERVGCTIIHSLPGYQSSFNEIPLDSE